MVLVTEELEYIREIRESTYDTKEQTPTTEVVSVEQDNLIMSYLDPKLIEQVKGLTQSITPIAPISIFTLQDTIKKLIPEIVSPELKGKTLSYKQIRYITYIEGGAPERVNLPIEVFVWYHREWSGFSEEELEYMFDIDIKLHHKIYANIWGVFRKAKLKMGAFSWILTPVIVVLIIYFAYKFISTYAITKATRVAKRKIL